MFLCNKNLKKAFTLAEMLITLVVISIVATLSINALNNSHQQKEAAISLQKAYEDISKAIVNGIIDNGDTDYWDFTLTADAFISTYLSTLNFDEQKLISSDIKDDRLDMLIDTNGNKMPNKLGIDRFPISILTDGTALLPTWNEDAEADKTAKTRAELLTNCKDNGYWCGALIQKDGWKIKKDYPWQDRKES